jgi:hypothetical protein
MRNQPETKGYHSNSGGISVILPDFIRIPQDFPRMVKGYPSGDLDHAPGFLGNDDFGPGNLRDIWPSFTRISGQ